jgi:hypothetical protein
MKKYFKVCKRGEYIWREEMREYGQQHATLKA